MIALDGNAIAGDLIEVLGVDLAAATCACASCGTSGYFAEAVVYLAGASFVTGTTLVVDGGLLLKSGQARLP